VGTVAETDVGLTLSEDVETFRLVPPGFVVVDAAKDASPYPMLRDLRATAPVHRGWPETEILEAAGDGPRMFTAYSFDAVKAVFTDNESFSTRCYEAIVRPLQGASSIACGSRPRSAWTASS
jgi:hypothetical protein